MPWGMSRTGSRKQVLEALDGMRDAAKEGADAAERTMIGAATEMVRATLRLAGRPKGKDGVRVVDKLADDYTVSVSASGHVDDEGGTYLYMNVTTKPAAPVDEDDEAEGSADRIREAIERATPPNDAAAVAE